jgi:protein transport protein SEC24
MQPHMCLAQYLNQPARAVIEQLLEALPQRHETTIFRESCLGSAVCAGLAALVCLNGSL